MRTKGKEYSGIAARHALVALRYSVAFRARVAPCQHSGSSSQMACTRRHRSGSGYCRHCRQLRAAVSKPNHGALCPVRDASRVNLC